MHPAEGKARFRKLFTELFQYDFPTKVFLVPESGTVRGLEHAPLYECPRLSICLTGAARYKIRLGNGTSEVQLKRGEAIYAMPNCVMEPHPQAHYLSFGIVFLPQFTRLLLARKLATHNGNFQHSFLTSYHSPGPLDGDGQSLIRLISRCSGRSSGDLYLRRIVQSLLIHTCEMLDENKPEPLHGKAYFTWQGACQFVREHLHEPIGREDVARFLGLHANHISRLFAQFEPGSFSQYVMQARLARSRELLHNPALNISQIAQASGFSDANYFIRCYRRKFGHPPGKARLSA